VSGRLPLRLDDTVRPIHYDLDLDVDLEGGTWVGHTDVTVLVTTSIDHIRLHSVDLVVTEATVRTSTGDEYPLEVRYHPEDEQLVLLPPAPLEQGQAWIHLRTEGVLGDALVGLYRSTFVDDDGGEHALAVTQFESTHARRAFPCFDEPHLKASFAVSVVADADHLVVSNAPERERVDLGGGRVRTTFEPTITMSTYLVAVVVGPLEATPPRASRSRAATPLRIIHPPGRGHLSAFALDVADHALGFLEDYYDLPYPGEKLDLVAVPDFAFGAMENLGCVTFREVLLLIDPDDSTQADQQRVADVVNHEIAHMWFGDLVTMRWWNGLWLNEAFATFMEVTASDAFRPAWDCWTGFGLLRSGAFDTDALESTRPIEYPVHTPADAEGMFDVLTYEKGCSVVRMLEQYLGAEEFRRGVRRYLMEHLGGSTETTDLWDSIEETTGQPVRRLMDAWILRPGHPEILVEETSTGVRIDQRRAAYRPELRAEAPRPVPLRITTSVRGVVRTQSLLLEEPVELDLGGPPDWVQPNTDGSGFFRTSLEPAAALRLAAAGRPALERFTLLDDTWAGVVAGTAGADLLLDLVTMIAGVEDDPSVWRRLAAVLGDLDHLSAPGGHERARTVARSVATERLRRIADAVNTGGEPTDEQVRSVRSIAFALAGGTGADPEVRDAARSLFGEGVGDPQLRSAAADVVARVATAEEHRELERRWRTAANPQDEIRYLHHLADTPRPEDLERTIALVFDDVRPQDRPYVLRRALRHPTLGHLAWDAVSRRWDDVLEGCSATAVGRMLEGLTSCTDRALAERIEAHLRAAHRDEPTRAVEQHLERMWVNVEAAERLRRDG